MSKPMVSILKISLKGLMPIITMLCVIAIRNLRRTVSDKLQEMIYTGMLSTLALSPTSPVWLVASVCAVIGLGTSAAVFIPYAILPNVIDVDELMTGSQRSGVYSGAMTLTRKLIQGALVMPLIGLFLQMVGFVSNAEQTPQVLSRFFIFFIGGPALLIVAGVVAATWFELSPRNSEIIAAELIRLRSGGKLDDAEDSVKAVCEKVSGQKHDHCNW